MNRIFLSIGTNKGDRMVNIIHSLKHIRSAIGDIEACSDVYCNDSWGFSSNEGFLNLVVEVFSTCNEKDVLESVQKIQSNAYSKQDNTLYNNREIDIDILFFNDLIKADKKLCIPHPLMHLRDFCLQPMNDIAPEMTHPVFNYTIEQLYKNSGFQTLTRFMTNSVLHQMLSES